MQTSSDRETLRSGRSGSGGDGCATEQISLDASGGSVFLNLIRPAMLE